MKVEFKKKKQKQKTKKKQRFEVSKWVKWNNKTLLKAVHSSQNFYLEKEDW